MSQRYHYEAASDLLIFSKPSHRNVGAVLLYGVGMVFVGTFLFWMSRYTVVSKQSEGNIICGVFWLLYISLLVIVEMGWLLEIMWQLWGVEIVKVGSNGIAITHKFGVLSRSVCHPANQIEEVRVDPLDNLWLTHGQELGFWTYRFRYGAIAVDCGRQVRRFGYGIDTDEAKRVVALIVQEYPQYLSRSADEKRIVPSEG
jgi:hypothetical protein